MNLIPNSVEEGAEPKLSFLLLSFVEQKDKNSLLSADAQPGSVEAVALLSYLTQSY